MKFSLKIVSIILGLGIVLGACSKNTVIAPKTIGNIVPENPNATIVIDLSIAAHRANAAPPIPNKTTSVITKNKDENKLKSIDLFVFKPDGSIDNHTTYTTAPDLEILTSSGQDGIKVTSGSRDIYAIANASSKVASVKSESELKAMQIKMFDGNEHNAICNQQAEALCMSAVSSKEIKRGDNKIPISLVLERNVARVTIGWNTDNTNSDKTVIADGAFKGDYFVTNSAFVVYARQYASIVNNVNLASVVNNKDELKRLYGGSPALMQQYVTAKTPILGSINTWNKDYYTYAFANANHKKMAGVLPTSSNQNGIPGECFFYLFPNAPATETCPGTSIVLGVSYHYLKVPVGHKQDEILYYNVEINGANSGVVSSTGTKAFGIKSNTVYNVYVKVTGPGSVNPLTPRKKANFTATITVDKWNRTNQVSNF